MQLVSDFIDEVDQEGLIPAIGSSFRFLYQRRAYFKVKQWWKYGRHYEAELDPYRIIWIDPNAIYGRGNRVIPDSRNNLTHVIGGEWDQQKSPFEDITLYNSMKRHFHEGVDWKQTELYNQLIEEGQTWLGITTESEFNEQCEYIDKLYYSIISDGYKTQRQIYGKKPRYPNEVKVKIGRNGNFFFQNGQHRLSIAKLLSLESIPVNVVVRHTEWQILRDELVSTKPSRQVSGQLEHYLDHPDISYLH